mmetsp:Transcript_207/g.470  ORF Transcript_207/g.470 Transcript_207/m.470 type:complete len:140 (+) Transcript_207:72-491(+)
MELTRSATTLLSSMIRGNHIIRASTLTSAGPGSARRHQASMAAWLFSKGASGGRVAGETGGNNLGRAFASTMGDEGAQKATVNSESQSLADRYRSWPAGPYIPITQAARLNLMEPDEARRTHRELYHAQYKGDDFEIFI